MKIAILSPELPPAFSGVGDYTVHFARGLLEKGENIEIWTAEPNAKKSQIIPHPWGWCSFKAFAQSLKKFQPDVILLQYTPQSLSPRSLGVWVSLPLWFWLLKQSVKQKKPLKTAILFHELYYPVEFTMRGLLLGLPQFIQFLFLILLSDQSFFPTEKALMNVQRLFFWKRTLAWLPVGSSIPVVSSFKLNPGSKKRLVHFGGLHPTHSLDHLLATHSLMMKEWGPARAEVVFLGVSEKELKKELLRRGLNEIPRGMIALGRLAEDQVSECLQSADLILAPFTDGISARRSTIMAALAHGKPILTTSGPLSEGETQWSEFCRVVPVDHLMEYAQQAHVLISDSAALSLLSQQARSAYLSRFTWAHIATRFLSYLSR